jgi:hypothetical protein
MVLLLLLYLALAWAAGVALTLLSDLSWRLEGRLAAALPLGFGAAALITWAIAVPIGMSGWPVVIGAIALVGITAAGFRGKARRARLMTEARSAVGRWRSLHALPFMILLALDLGFFVPFFTHAYENEIDGVHVGYYTMYGDWAHHLAQSNYFARASRLLPPQNPDFAGVSLPYPFLPDFFSGVLQHLGADPFTALVVPSAILCIALILIFYSVGEQLTGSRWTPLLGALIFFGGSGLGFTRVAGDVVSTGDGPLGWLGGLVNLVLRPPHQYTMDADLNYQWLNPILAYLLPQRSTVFGWGVGLLALALLWHAWRRGGRRDMAIAGLATAAIPWLNTNTFIDIAIIAGGVALLSRRRWRDWLWFFVPVVVLGGVQGLMLLPPAAYRHPFGAFQLGWMAASDGHNDNVLWFWLINTGLLIPLALLTLLRPAWLPAGLRRFLLPTWLLFIIPNLFTLQVWNWDNTKWLVWWAMPASLLAAAALAAMARRHVALAALAGVLVFVQLASGSLDLIRAWQEPLNSPALRLLDNDELSMGEWARTETPPDSVFLASWQFNNPVRTLSGRVEVVGGLTSLWTTDIDYRGRMGDVIAMYHGDPRAELLLQHYRVGYVVVGPYETRDIGVDEAFYKSRYPVAYRSPTAEYTVYKVG